MLSTPHRPVEPSLAWVQIQAGMQKFGLVCTYNIHCGSKKNAPTLADYNYDPIQSIFIIFSMLFANDHKSLSGGKIFHLTAHMLPLYLVKHNALFCTNYTAYRKKMRQLRITITSISVKEF